MNRVFLITTVLLVTAGVVFGTMYRSPLFQTPSANGPHITMVSLRDNKMTPDTILVHSGDFVQFNTKDGQRHDIDQGHGAGYGSTHDHEVAGIGSGKFGPSEAYRLQFKKVGIYDFHDHENPEMRATVIVK